MDKEKTLEEMTEEDFNSGSFEFIQGANLLLPNCDLNNRDFFDIYDLEDLIPDYKDKIQKEAPVGTAKYAFGRTNGEISISPIRTIIVNYFKTKAATT